MAVEFIVCGFHRVVAVYLGALETFSRPEGRFCVASPSGQPG
ncbi:hypothetical protein DFO68_102205 [Halomonas ventosae]|uniref:Uncharacterized protein n=1 Tax=Halomonas ventosae TaxID=229007 RepID=A0A4R6I1H8_9GAMM|nr:hypothetical protein DFO68_102205 [Halomonas ventosae]